MLRITVDIEKKASKTYAEVVSGTSNATDFNGEMKDIKVKEVPHKNKEDISLTSIFENLLRDNSSIPQETLSLPKICTDTSLSGNTSNILCTSENLDNQDFEFLNILEDLIKYLLMILKNLLKELKERLTILFKTRHL